MKRYLSPLSLAIVLSLITTGVIYAQEPTAPPDTAIGGLELLAAALALVPGLLTTLLMDELVKIPWLENRPEEKQVIRDIIVKSLTPAIAIGSAWLMETLTPVANLVDQNTAWGLLVCAWPAAQVWYEGRKVIRAFVANKSITP